VNTLRLTGVQLGYVNKAFWRNPTSAFFTFAFPLIFLVIFTALLGHFTVQIGSRSVSSSTYYVASMATFSVITACFNNIAMMVTFQREDGILKRVVNAIILPLEFLSGIFIAFGNDTPAWILWIARVFPVRHFALSMQAGFIGTAFSWTDVLIVAAWGAAGVLLGVRFFSWEPRQG
jgi:ABC-2 type transport system permease protein